MKLRYLAFAALASTALLSGCTWDKTPDDYLPADPYGQSKNMDEQAWSDNQQPGGNNSDNIGSYGYGDERPSDSYGNGSTAEASQAPAEVPFDDTRRPGSASNTGSL